MAKEQGKALVTVEGAECGLNLIWGGDKEAYKVERIRVAARIPCR